MKKKSKPIPRSRRRLVPAAPLPPSEPVDVTMRKARRLPLFGPGIEITLPLHLLPAYQDLYNLVPMTLGEVRDMEKRLGRRKPAGMLWVKRVPKQGAITARKIIANEK